MAKAKYPAEWKLTALEQKYLDKLKSGKLLHSGDLIALHDSMPATEKKLTQNVSRVISSLRKKLDPVDVQIETVWGEGWKIGRVFRARLTELINKAKADV